MRTRKKIKYIVSLLSVAVLAFVCGVQVMPQIKTASAATLSGIVFEDDFSSKTLSEKWLKSDFEIDENSYYSMRFDNQTAYGAAVLYTDYKIHDDCVISFDFCQSKIVKEKASANWFGVLFGYNDDSSHFTGGNAALLSYGSGLTQLMDDNDGMNDTLVATSYNNHSKFLTSFMADATDKIYTVEFVLTYTGTRYSDGESLYKLDAYYYEKSGERSKLPKYTYKAIAADGYFGFSAMASAVIDVSNLKIIEDDKIVVSENFQKSDGTGKKIFSSSDGSYWKGCNVSESNVYTSFNGKINASNIANGLLLGNYELKSDIKNNKTFEISFTTEIDDLPEDSGFGLTLGLEKTSLSMIEGSFIGVKGIADDSFVFVHLLNGEIIAQSSAVPKKLYENGQTSIKFIGYYDGSLAVTFGNYTVSFENAAKDGFVGLATLGEMPCKVCFDDFSIVRSDYVGSTAPNLAIDFTGTKETVEDDFTYYERYVNERVWFLGQGVAFQKVFKQDATFIQFTDSNERSFFGAKQTYSEFICRFSVTITQNRADSVGSYIGLSFGKPNRNDSASETPSILFGMTDDGMILQANNCTISGGNSKGVVKQYETYPELDFWSAEKWQNSPATYRVMVVVRGGIGYVYYANESDMSEINVCKAILTDMETSGYVTVSALGGATFRLNDFAITNISTNAKNETVVITANSENVEYVNVDFTNSELYSVTGNAKKTNNGLSLGYDTQVKVNEKYSDFMCYVDLNTFNGNGIKLKIGDNFICLSADGGFYSDMNFVGSVRKFDLSELKNGGIVMIETIGTRVSVGIANKNQTADLLEQYVAIFDRSESTGQSTEITVSTLSETIVSLESIRMYSLKPTIEISADNYEVTDMEIPVKNAPATDKSNQSCNSTISFDLPLMAIVIILLGATVLLIKKAGNRR